MSRLHGAIDAIRQIIAQAADIPASSFEDDDDLVEDLGLKTLELVSVGLIIEEIFSIAVPDDLFESALYRTPEALAEWAVRQANAASYQEARAQPRKRA
jgi:acyl carrier protein